MTKDEAQPAPVQEPVACGHCNGSGRMVRDPDIGTDQECFVCDGAGVPAAPVQEPLTGLDIYLDPNDGLKPKRYPAAQRQWVHATEWRGLTDEEIELLNDCGDTDSYKFARAIEAKLKEKNT